MADQILNAIIQLESQIEQQLQEEQRRADACLERLRCELEADASQLREQIRKTNQRLLAEAESAAENDYDDILDAEKAYCHRLEGLSEEALEEVLRRQLTKLLPRPVDDHQNGES